LALSAAVAGPDHRADGLLAERDTEIVLRQAQLTQADSEILMKDRKPVWSVGHPGYPRMVVRP
jgi:hypothetical protein